MSIIVELPFPDSHLMPNARVFHKAKAQYARTARGTAMYEAYNAKPRYDYSFPIGERIPVTLKFYPPNHRERDLDNLLAAMKSALDGVCDALEINDKMFSPITIDWGSVEKGGRVVVVIGKEPTP
jgi:Holliday junction resolvase RusA-like endonuclease